jgi:hypothetical protein
MHPRQGLKRVSSSLLADLFYSTLGGSIDWTVWCRALQGLGTLV